MEFHLYLILISKTYSFAITISEAEPQPLTVSDREYIITLVDLLWHSWVIRSTFSDHFLNRLDVSIVHVLTHLLPPLPIESDASDLEVECLCVIQVIK